MWDCISFGFIVKWVKKYPIDGKPMKLTDLPGAKTAASSSSSSSSHTFLVRNDMLCQDRLGTHRRNTVDKSGGAFLAGDNRKLMTPYREKFVRLWTKSGGKTSGALLRWMAPWWLFTHSIQTPRKYVCVFPTIRSKQTHFHRECRPILDPF